MVIDNASKQAVEEMRQRYTLPLIPAEKTGKRDYIELLNSDLTLGHIRILPKAQPLVDEWASLVWDERKFRSGKYEEHPTCPNHLSDAFLYAWRYVYNYCAKPKYDKPLPNSEEAVEDFWERESEMITNKPIWQRDEEYL